MIIASVEPNLRTDFNKRDFKIEVIQVRSLVIESSKSGRVCDLSDSSFVMFFVLTYNMEKQKQK